MKKSFKEFLEQATISYPGTPSHDTWKGGKLKKVPAGKALPRKSPSSSGGGHGGGGGGHGGSGGGHGGGSGGSGGDGD
jgi:hypothetical protein